MPSTNLSGKTKADLVVLAELSGLLTSSQAKKMTRAVILEILLKADQESSGQKTEKSADKEVNTAKPASRSSAYASGNKLVAKRKSNIKAAKSEEKPVAAPTESVATEVNVKPKRKIKSGITAVNQPEVPAENVIKSKPPAARKPKMTRKDTNVDSQINLPASGPEIIAELNPVTETEQVSESMPTADLVQLTLTEDSQTDKIEKSESELQSDVSVKTGRNINQKRSSSQRQKDNRVSGRNQKRPDKIHGKTENKNDKTTDSSDVSVEPVSDTKAVSDISDQSAAQLETEKSSDVNKHKQERPTDTRHLTTKSGEEGKPRRPMVEAGELVSGSLEIMPDGYGFLRKDNYLQGSKDIYVPPQYIRRFGLRTGDWVSGPGKQQRETDRYQALLYIKEVNGMSPEKMIRRPQFDRLTPIYPDERYRLETARNELSTRIIDLAAPIGRGQRGMIVSPPKAGKTILLQKIANAISINNPEVKLIVLLIDERPEEVTDMQRSIKGEVVYSTFDKTPENHVKVTELVLERAMRLVELKQDVVILLDSMTRLARAYNLTINPTGRTLSGGLDPGALYGPKRFFGAARNIENGGSLTIIATSLIETGSRMDEVIFEEFKGTGNMEVYLDRKLSEKRIFPAIDINRSGTRREELLMTGTELDAVWTIRKAFSQLDTSSVTETIINLLLKTQNNDHFISSINVSFNDKNVFDAMRGTRTGNGNAPAAGNGADQRQANGKQY